MATVYADITDQDQEEIRRVLAILREVVEESGSDYVYVRNEYDTDFHLSGCRYVKAGQPDCIAAKVLTKLGMDIYVLAMCEGLAVNHIPDRVEPGKCPIGPVAAGVLRVAQIQQDNGATWGTASEKARDAAFIWYGITES